MQLQFSVTFACCGNVEILVSTWCEKEVVQILKMILGKNFWCADSPGLQVYKSASLQVCKSASLQVCKSASLQVCKCRTPLGTRLDGQDIPSRSVFDRATLKNFKVRYLRVLLGNQHTNLEGVNYCFIHKSSLFLFSSLCGVAWISVPLKSGGTVQQISRWVWTLR